MCISCTFEGKEVGDRFCRNFIQSYVVLNSFEISPVFEKKKISINCSGERVHPWYQLYDTFSSHYGDVSYNRRMVPGLQVCMADTLLYIHVIGHTDYDAAHTAGTSLNDIIEIEFSSPLRYIQSQYKDIPQSEMKGGFRPQDEFSPFRIALDNITKDDLILIYTIMNLNFISYPDNPNQIITVEIGTSSGKRLSQTRELQFN
jgi:hypothetical protein